MGHELMDDASTAIISAAGGAVVRARDAAEALRVLIDQPAEVVIADSRNGPELTAEVRSRRDLAAMHIIICAPLNSPHKLRVAFDAGADDVMRVPFEPEVLAARVAAGLGAARLRASEALLSCWWRTFPAPSIAARATRTGRCSG